MRRAFGFTLVGLLGLSVQITACAEGTTLPSENGGGGAGGDPCTSELCDGLDNDCDGMVDEECKCDPGQTGSCYSGAPETANVGMCKSGTHECDPATNTFGACMGDVLPALETCNVLDDDCNGVVDDGVAEITCGVGACMVAVSGCTDGAPGACVPGEPAVEICDGLDNDCDQLTDETYPEKGQMCNTGQPGACEAGMSQCLVGMLMCEPMNMATTEQCDQIDNDCNGMVDDNVPNTGTACETGLLGVCLQGTLSCQGGIIDCFSDVTSSTESCDSLDNDCDGIVDNNIPGAGVACDTGEMGACAQGTQMCIAGMSMCQRNAAPLPESCNGIDDDCNGQTDEGNPGNGLPCTCGGTFNCANGGIVCQGCTTEVNCSDGANEDGDTEMDCLDSDCALGCVVEVGPCAAGETLLVVSSLDIPKPIPDAGATTSTIAFSETFMVKRVVLQVDIAHTWDQDLGIRLTSPSNTTIKMSDDNGQFFDHYTNTIFNSSCATPIISGMAPFSGCYSPEEPLTGFNNQPLKGTWTLSVSDKNTGDTGMINSWKLAMCVQ